MRGFRTFLLVFGLCGVVFAIAVPFAWRGIKNLKEPITDELRRVVDDAAAFAGAHEQLDCEPEAFRRLAACDGLWCQVQTPIFTQECLKRAHPSPTLCDDMPKSMLEGALWPTKRCSSIDADSQICQRIVLEVLEACGRRHKAH